MLQRKRQRLLLSGALYSTDSTLRTCFPALRSIVLASYVLHEKLNPLGALGCALCLTGSLLLALHAGHAQAAESVLQLWALATEPASVSFAFMATAAIVYLVYFYVPLRGGFTGSAGIGGSNNSSSSAATLLVHVAVASLAGSLAVVSCKVLGIAIKLTWQVRCMFM